MLVAVVANVHACDAALTAVLAAIDRAGAHRVLMLGELVDRGPDLRAVESRLAARRDLERVDPHQPATLIRGRRHQLWIGASPEAGGVELVPSGGAEARQDGGAWTVAPGAVGAPVLGDPRSAVAFVQLDEGLEPKAWIARVPFDLAATAERIEALGADPREREPHARYLRSFLGKEAASLGPLDRHEPQASAPIKLLMPRIRDVYRRATEEGQPVEIDWVHEVRVASRRLRAALAVAGRMLRKGDRKRAKGRLKALGAALGARRSADVMAAHLAALAKEPWAEPAVIARMTALTQVRLRRSEQELSAAQLRWRWIRDGVELVTAAMFPAPDAPTLEDALRAEVAQRLEVVREGALAIGRPHDDVGHHELRIALKRLRYTCELGEGPFPELSTLGAPGRLKALQDALGALHDQVEVLHLLHRPRVARRAKDHGVTAQVPALIADLERWLER